MARLNCNYLRVGSDQGWSGVGDGVELETAIYWGCGWDLALLLLLLLMMVDGGVMERVLMMRGDGCGVDGGCWGSRI